MKELRHSYSGKIETFLSRLRGYPYDSNNKLEQPKIDKNTENDSSNQKFRFSLGGKILEGNKRMSIKKFKVVYQIISKGDFFLFLTEMSCN